MKKSKMAMAFTFICAKNKMSIKHLFCICGSRLLNLWGFYDLQAVTHISVYVYISSSDLYFIVKSKVDVILHIYN